MNLERLKDEAYAINQLCKSITVATNKIVNAEDELRACLEFGYLDEKVNKLMKAYNYFLEAK